MTKINTLIAVFFVVLLRAQNPVPDSNTNKDPTIENFSYPLFLGGEKHTSFKVNYQLTDRLQAELQGFYDTYLFEDRFRSSIVLKHYLSNKLYVFGGLGMEVITSSRIGSGPPRVSVIGGLGYDVNKNFMLEAKSDIGINKTSMGAFGESNIKMPQVHTIGGKIKF